MTTNYFAVSSSTETPGPGKRRDVTQFFFDDRRPGSVRAAFELAQSTFLLFEDQDPQLASFRRPALSGPWDGFPVVGEFSADEIN